jgi:hypothetical protein
MSPGMALGFFWALGGLLFQGLFLSFQRYLTNYLLQNEENYIDFQPTLPRWLYVSRSDTELPEKNGLYTT